LQKGQLGDDVVELQLRLAGFRGTLLDGDFGPGTELQAKVFQAVSKLALADEEAWDDGFATGLTRLDNGIEHVVIVPVELVHHQDRREHWEAVGRGARPHRSKRRLKR